MGEELADREGALLAVNHFKRAALAHAPIHDIERKTLQDGFDDGLLLLQIISKLALIGRADVQPSAVPLHTCIGIIAIAVYQFANAYGLQFYLHIRFLYLLLVRCLFFKCQQAGLAHQPIVVFLTLKAARTTILLAPVKWQAVSLAMDSNWGDSPIESSAFIIG